MVLLPEPFGPAKILSRLTLAGKGFSDLRRGELFARCYAANDFNTSVFHEFHNLIVAGHHIETHYFHSSLSRISKCAPAPAE